MITSLGRGGLVCKGRNSIFGRYQYTAEQTSPSLRATAVWVLFFLPQIRWSRITLSSEVRKNSFVHLFSILSSSFYVWLWGFSNRQTSYLLYRHDNLVGWWSRGTRQYTYAYFQTPASAFPTFCELGKVPNLLSVPHTQQGLSKRYYSRFPYSLPFRTLEKQQTVCFSLLADIFLKARKMKILVIPMNCM